MDFQKPKGTPNVAITLLVLLNLALLVTIWYSRLKPQPQPPIYNPLQNQQTQTTDPSHQQSRVRPLHINQRRQLQEERLASFLKKELDFSQKQIEAFFQLRNTHFNSRETLRRQINDLRKEMMDHLFDEPPDQTEVQRLATKLGEKTAQLEKSVFDHFQELMKICTPDQEKRYRSLLREILEQLRPPEHRPPPKRLRNHPPQRPDGKQGMVPSRPEDREPNRPQDDNQGRMESPRRH